MTFTLINVCVSDPFFFVAYKNESETRTIDTQNVNSIELSYLFDKFIGNLIICGGSFFFHFFTDFHREMAQTFAASIGIPSTSHEALYWLAAFDLLHKKMIKFFSSAHRNIMRIE